MGLLQGTLGAKRANCLNGRTDSEIHLGRQALFKELVHEFRLHFR